MHQSLRCIAKYQHQTPKKLLICGFLVRMVCFPKNPILVIIYDKAILRLYFKYRFSSVACGCHVFCRVLVTSVNGCFSKKNHAPIFTVHKYQHQTPKNCSFVGFQEEWCVFQKPVLVIIYDKAILCFSMQSKQLLLLCQTTFISSFFSSSFLLSPSSSSFFL